MTLPLLLPLLPAAFVVRGVATFNQFYLFWVLGPNDHTTTLSTFSYSLFTRGSGPGLFSVSAAINVVTLVALAIVVAWFLRWRQRAERVAFAMSRLAAPRPAPPPGVPRAVGASSWCRSGS